LISFQKNQNPEGMIEENDFPSFLIGSLELKDKGKDDEK